MFREACQRVWGKERVNKFGGKPHGISGEIILLECRAAGKGVWVWEGVEGCGCGVGGCGRVWVWVGVGVGVGVWEGVGVGGPCVYTLSGSVGRALD